METPRGDDILREKLSNLSLSRDDTHYQEAPEVICDENTNSQKPKKHLKDLYSSVLLRYWNSSKVAILR